MRLKAVTHLASRRLKAKDQVKNLDIIVSHVKALTRSVVYHLKNKVKLKDHQSRISKNSFMLLIVVGLTTALAS